MYGMTETCTAFTCTRADEPLPIRLTTCGALMPENEIAIVDIESGEPVKPGEPGEILRQGPGGDASATTRSTRPRSSMARASSGREISGTSTRRAG